MIELNINKWKEFKVSDIFNKIKVKKYSKIPKKNGLIPFVTSQSVNNGISKLIDATNFITCPANSITISTNGKCFDVFYHSREIVISSDVEILYGSFLTENIALFLVTILKKNAQKYNFGQKPKNNAVWDTIILLPSFNSNRPDWQYMDEYIKSLRERERESYELFQNYHLKKSLKLEANLWHEYKINSFNIYSSKYPLDKNKLSLNFEDEKYNYVSRTNSNNGITKLISKQNVPINSGHCLTIGLDTQTVFYQEKDFYTGQNIHILRINNCNKYCYLFIATIIKIKIKKMYSWGGNGATLGRLKNETILLPKKHNGDIDWEYMENYIKSLPWTKHL